MQLIPRFWAIIVIGGNKHTAGINKKRK